MTVCEIIVLLAAVMTETDRSKAHFCSLRRSQSALIPSLLSDSVTLQTLLPPFMPNPDSIDVLMVCRIDPRHHLDAMLPQQVSTKDRTPSLWKRNVAVLQLDTLKTAAETLFLKGSMMDHSLMVLELWIRVYCLWINVSLCFSHR